MNAIEKAFYRTLAKPNTLSILNYHQVVATQDSTASVEMDAERFALQLSWLKAACNVLSLREANNLRLQGKLPRSAVAITFDDGYANNVEVALPLLQQANLPATFFVCSAYLRGGKMWNDTVIDCVHSLEAGHVADLEALVPGIASLNLANRMQSPYFRPGSVADSVVGCFKYLPAGERSKAVGSLADLVGISGSRGNVMMSPDQLRQLHDAGMEVGGHTVNHPILSGLSYRNALQEIAENKQWLEECLNEEVSSFAYPNGKPRADYNTESVRAVKAAGFQIAVTTVAGASTAKTDSLQLPRFTPWDRSRRKFLTRLMQNTHKCDNDQL